MITRNYGLIDPVKRRLYRAAVEERVSASDRIDVMRSKTRMGSYYSLDLGHGDSETASGDGFGFLQGAGRCGYLARRAWS
jgi:hypothetical protein